MDKNAAKRWRPLVRAAIQSLELDEATDAILALLPGPERRSTQQEAAPAPPAPKPPRRTEPGRRADTAAPSGGTAAADGLLDTKPPLAAEAYFSVQQASEYIGIGTERLYQILRDSPERLPHKKEPGRGHDTYRIRGKAINDFRAERLRTSRLRLLKQPTPPVIQDDDDEDDEDEGGEEGGRGATYSSGAPM